MNATQNNTMVEAVKTVKDGVRNGVRGPGCAVIVMADGRRYHLVSVHDTLVERYEDCDVVERLPAAEIMGEVECVSWTCDESGAVYIR